MSNISFFSNLRSILKVIIYNYNISKINWSTSLLVEYFQTNLCLLKLLQTSINKESIFTNSNLRTNTKSRPLRPNFENLDQKWPKKPIFHKNMFFLKITQVRISGTEMMLGSWNFVLWHLYMVSKKARNRSLKFCFFLKVCPKLWTKLAKCPKFWT